MFIGCDQRQFTRLRIYSNHAAENPNNKYCVTEESKLWSNQIVISYFFDTTESGYKRNKEPFVIAAMKEYAKYANVKFAAAKDRYSASVRITFQPGDDKQWVAVGTDALMVDPKKATMNLGWIDLDKTDATNSAIALHAIGHVLGLVHENQKLPMSNFSDYDKDSIMKYSDVTTSTDANERQLSERDKAWLTLNYPKALINKDGGPENIWTIYRSLRVLNIDDGYSLRILNADDISERRFLYSQFLASKRPVPDKLTDQNTLGGLMGRLPDYPDVLLKLQAQVGPKAVPGRILPNAPPRPADIEQCILDLLPILKFSDKSSTSNQPSRSDKYGDIEGVTSAVLRYMDLVESGEFAERPLEEQVTQEELDSVRDQLPEVLNHDPKNGPSADVQYGVLTQLPGMQKILEWFSRSVSETRTHARDVPSGATEKILDMLRNSPPQNVFQEVYSLCFASTLVHDINGKQTDLQSKLQEFLHSLLPLIKEPEETAAPGWELVWGPVVWKVEPEDDLGGPDLVWYIAYNPSVVCGDDEPRPTYVVAIAGTQMRSVHTWLNSNFDVTSPIDFKSWLSNLRSNPNALNLPKADIKLGSPYIAMGTAQTVGKLLTIVPPPGAEAASQTLLEFLKSHSQSNPDMRIITTGHSLGGALSPTLAVVLVELDIVLRDRILTYPIAGPSPGNDAFAAFFSETLLPIPAKQDDLAKQRYQVWNFNLVNENDPVPQAWCSNKHASPKQNLQNVQKLVPGSLLKRVISAIVTSVVGDLSESKVQYMPLRSQIFSSAPSESFKDVAPQHSEGYHEYVGITPPSLQDALR